MSPTTLSLHQAMRDSSTLEYKVIFAVSLEVPFADGLVVGRDCAVEASVRFAVSLETLETFTSVGANFICQ